VGFKAHKQVLKEAEEAEKLAEAEAKKARRKAEAALQRKTEEARKKAEAKAEKTVEELWEDVWNKEPGPSHYSKTRTWTTYSTDEPQQDPWGNPSRGRSAQNTRQQAEAKRREEAYTQKQAQERQARQAQERQAEATRQAEARATKEADRMKSEGMASSLGLTVNDVESINIMNSKRYRPISSTEKTSGKQDIVRIFNALIQHHSILFEVGNLPKLTMDLDQKKWKKQLLCAMVKLHPDVNSATAEAYKAVNQLKDISEKLWVW
jgi:hypothetical protein